MIRAAAVKKVVVVGGGTGNFVVLKGLKKYPLDLTAIVSMADDGGSTGILRDELGVLPPGDVRQCLVALSNSSRLMRSLMNYRFENGGLEGHSFGNLLLSALEKVTGSFEKAVEEAGKILYIKGKVIPVTTHQVRLKMLLNNRKILEGEKEIYLSQEIDKGYKSIYLEPHPTANPHAIDAILNPNIKLVSIQGVAGTGKTLLSIAGALEQRRNFHQIYIARPIVPLSNKDIGYLPGDIKSKLNPYMEPLWDNLKFIKSLFGEKDKEYKQIEEMVEKEKIIVCPLAYIRGR
ncbi:MAG: 2-phospho-L-lactate transferase CofD family protein, partial [Chlamydiota bacterium]